MTLRSSVLYRPLPVDMGEVPQWKPSPFTDFFALLDKNERRKEQKMQNEEDALVLGRRKKLDEAGDVLAQKWKERRATGELPTEESLLPEMRDILGEQGLVEEALSAQKAIENSGVKRDREQMGAIKDILDIAKIDPELASLLWEQQGLGAPPSDFARMQKQPSYKATSGLGIWHVDPDSGQVVVDKEISKQYGPAWRVMKNKKGQEVVVDIKDPQQFRDAQAAGFRYHPPGIFDEEPDEEETTLNDTSWFSKLAGAIENLAQGGAKSATPAPEQQSPAAPPRQAKPGMKWQVNTQTGEFREVPR